MKLAVIIALLAASTAASANEWTITSDNGSTFEVIPHSVRAYQNDRGHRQFEALVEVESPNVNGRSLVGVVGCAVGRGLIANINPDGTPAVDPLNWIVGGKRVYDSVATLICLAAARAGLISGNQPRSNQQQKGLNS